MGKSRCVQDGLMEIYTIEKESQKLLERETGWGVVWKR